MTRLIAFGDSIFAGWDGKENLPASERIPEIIGQAMGWEVTNTAISGAKYDDRPDASQQWQNPTVRLVMTMR